MTDQRIIQADNRGRVLLRSEGVYPLAWYEVERVAQGWLIKPVVITSVKPTNEGDTP